MNKNVESPQKCYLCNVSLDKLEVVGDFVYGGTANQKFYRCSNCDVAFLYPRMTKKQEKKFYSKEFEKFMEKRAGKDFDWSGPQTHITSNERQYRRRLHFFKDLVASGRSVLEIGCSSGFMLLPLKKKGLKVVGVEPSGGFTSYLRDQNIAVFNSLEKLNQSKFCLKKFNLVMHFFVLEHVREPVSFLKQSFEFVKVGGCMVFEVPSRSDPLLTIYNIPAFQKFYWSVAHNYYFTRKSLEYILRQVSDEFKIIPEQRYDLSNHIVWALEGKPGGQGKYKSFFTPELEKAYLESMTKGGYCDTLIAKIYKRKGS